jgi:photosystem II stability/assembly factor-like uncharacterized protein
MKKYYYSKIILAVFFIVSLNSVDLYPQWIPQTSGVTNLLTSVSFPDNLNGFACGGTGIIKTTNGGNSWVSMNNPKPGYVFSKLSFINKNFGSIIGPSGCVYHTTNGGNDWVIQPASNPTTGFENIQIIDSLYGIATAPGGTIVRTSDGGKSWTLSKVGYFDVLYGVSFSDRLNGLIVGTRSLILRTSDGGDTWVKQVSPVSGENLFSVSFPDKNHATAVGSLEIILRTSDGGKNWINRSIYNSGYQLWSVSYIDSLNGAVVGQYNNHTSEMLWTTNGGNSWLNQSTTQCEGLHAVCLSDSKNGTALGAGGGIYRTTNGGVTFIKNGNILSPPMGYILYQNFPNPFNSTTIIKCYVPGGRKSSLITLEVYNLLGQKLVSLFNEEKPPGEYEVNFNADNFNLPSGIYMYRLSSGEFSSIKKMVYLK